MKFLNSFKKEIKNKWSTRLLVGVFSLIFCSVFASNILLKNEYNRNKNSPKDALKDYKKIVNQPFKHIELENSPFPHSLQFDTSSQFSVFAHKTQVWDGKESSDNIFVKNDTLFVKQKEHFPELGRISKPIRIFAPQIETITISKGSLFVHSLNQKSINIHLSNQARLELSNSVSDIDSCKISMSNLSSFIVNYLESPKNLTIHTLEAYLSGDSELHLANARVKNLKLNTTDDNRIQLSSETLKALLK